MWNMLPVQVRGHLYLEKFKKLLKSWITEKIYSLLKKIIPLLFYFSYFMLCELKVFLFCPVLQGGKLKWVSEDFVYKYILIGL